MFKIILTTICALSLNLHASIVEHWMPECQVYRCTNGGMYIWDGNHSYRIEYLIHDLSWCPCILVGQGKEHLIDPSPVTVDGNCFCSTIDCDSEADSFPGSQIID